MTHKCDKESGQLGLKNHRRFIGDSIMKVKPSMYLFRVSAQEHLKLTAKLVRFSHMFLVLAA